MNKYTLNSQKKEVFKNAREYIKKQLPSYAFSVEHGIAKGLPLKQPRKSCLALMDEILTKVFNANANAILRRYHSTYLARGGKASSLSSNREQRKHEGNGKGKKGPKKKDPKKKDPKK